MDLDPTAFFGSINVHLFPFSHLALLQEPAKKPKKKKEAAAVPVSAKGLPVALELAGKPKKKS